MGALRFGGNTEEREGFGPPFFFVCRAWSEPLKVQILGDVRAVAPGPGRWASRGPMTEALDLDRCKDFAMESRRWAADLH